MPRTAPQRVDAKWFRRVLGQYPTGVSIITGIAADERPVGLAVGTFTSVSLEPPLVAFLPDRGSTSWPKIEPSGSFAINVLSAEQEHICRVFATKEPDKFRGLDWRPAGSGAPIIDGAVAWIDCELETVHEAGDHFIVIGRVLELDADTRSLPLLFFQGGYGRFTPLSMASDDADLTRQLTLADLARPEMERIAAELRGRCVASALVGDEIVHVAGAGASTGRTPRLVGTRTPAVASAGMLFMAWAPEASVERWLAGVESAEQRSALRERLRATRSRGYLVGLRDPSHGRFERIVAERAGRGSEAGGVEPELRALMERLPYGRSWSLAEPAAVRSLHVPVFGADEQVALGLSLFLPSGAGCDTAELERGLKALKHAAASVTSASGGRMPSDFPAP